MDSNPITKGLKTLPFTDFPPELKLNDCPSITFGGVFDPNEKLDWLDNINQGDIFKFKFLDGSEIKFMVIMAGGDYLSLKILDMERLKCETE